MSVLNMYPLIMIINAGWKMPEAWESARWVEEDDTAGARCVHHCHCAGPGNNWIPVVSFLNFDIGTVVNTQYLEKQAKSLLVKSNAA